MFFYPEPGLSDADGKVREIVVGYSDSYLVCAFSASNKDDQCENCREQLHWFACALMSRHSIGHPLTEMSMGLPSGSCTRVSAW
jgi:hypothetical protein